MVKQIFGSAFFILLSSTGAEAARKPFAALTDCWTALNGAPIRGANAQLKQDFHLIQVQRTGDGGRTSSAMTVGKDNFLVLNSEGAQLLVPTSSTDAKGTSDGVNNYQMSIKPPGETQKMQVAYFTFKRDPRSDALGWYGPAGDAKKKDDLYAKYANDPVKTLDFADARDAVRMIFKEKAKSEQADLDKTKNRLQFWSHADYYLPDGRITRQSPEKLRQHIEEAMGLVNACSEVDDETIKQAGLQQKETLRQQKEFLDSIAAEPVRHSGPKDALRGGRGTR